MFLFSGVRRLFGGSDLSLDQDWNDSSLDEDGSSDKVLHWIGWFFAGSGFWIGLGLSEDRMVIHLDLDLGWFFHWIGNLSMGLDGFLSDSV